MLAAAAPPLPFLGGGEKGAAFGAAKATKGRWQSPIECGNSTMKLCQSAAGVCGGQQPAETEHSRQYPVRSRWLNSTHLPDPPHPAVAAAAAVACSTRSKSATTQARAPASRIANLLALLSTTNTDSSCNTEEARPDTSCSCCCGCCCCCFALLLPSPSSLRCAVSTSRPPARRTCNSSSSSSGGSSKHQHQLDSTCGNQPAELSGHAGCTACENKPTARPRPA